MTQKAFSHPSSYPCQTLRYSPDCQQKASMLSLPRMMALVQHLRCYFENGKLFEVFTVIKDSPVVLAFTEVVSPCFLCYSLLMHIPESPWELWPGPEPSPFEAVLLAGRFPLYTLLRNNQANHPHLQHKINDTQNERPTMYDQEQGCITGSNSLTSVQLSHEMTPAYITLRLIIRNKTRYFE